MSDPAGDPHVAVVGTGARAERLAEVLATVVPGVRASGVPASRPPEGASALVVVGSSDDVGATLRRCLEHQTPALCDPAYAASVARIDEVTVLAGLESQQPGRLVTVGLARRHDPRFRALREEVVAGEIGEPRLSHARVEIEDPRASLVEALAVELDTWSWLTGAEPLAAPSEPLGDGLLVTATTAGGGVLDLELRHGPGEVRWEVVGTRGSAELVTTAAWSAEAERIQLTAWVRSLSAGSSADGTRAGLAEALRAARAAEQRGGG